MRSMRSIDLPTNESSVKSHAEEAGHRSSSLKGAWINDEVKPLGVNLESEKENGRLRFRAPSVVYQIVDLSFDKVEPRGRANRHDGSEGTRCELRHSG